MDDFNKGKLYLGADIDGYEAKEALRDHLDGNGYLVIDLGVFEVKNQANYNDIAREVSEKVVENGRIKDNLDHGTVTLGILISGDSGKMMASANQLDGAKAFVVDDLDQAPIIRAQYDANIVCVGTDDFSTDEVIAVVSAFLA